MPKPVLLPQLTGKWLDHQDCNPVKISDFYEKYPGSAPFVLGLRAFNGSAF